MIILQEAINTFSFSPHIDKEFPADKPVTCLRGFFCLREKGKVKSEQVRCWLRQRFQLCRSAAHHTSSRFTITCRPDAKRQGGIVYSCASPASISPIM